MTSYWWGCTSCGTKYDFKNVFESRGITHYIWVVLIASGWDPFNLLNKCNDCGKDQLRITYRFPRAEETPLQVKYMVELGPFEEYVPMMWETIPNGASEQTWIDFKYVNVRNIWRLAFGRGDIGKLFELYRDRTGDRLIAK